MRAFNFEKSIITTRQAVFIREVEKQWMAIERPSRSLIIIRGIRGEPL